jgi:uncharacterized protein YrrD
MKRIEDMLGMPIVTVDEGLRLGKLKGVEVDLAEGRIRYLRLDGEGGRADGFIPWGAIRSVGADAITVQSKAAVGETIPAADRDRVVGHLGDRAVVTEGGARLGQIVSYDVDEQTGMLLGYRVGTGGLLGRLTGSTLDFPHGAVRTIGRDAIIVSNDVTQQKAA